VYRDTLNDLRSEMAKVYERVAVDGRLTLADMRKYNRLENLEKQINTVLGQGTQKARASMIASQRRLFMQSADLYAQAMEEAVGRKLPFGMINKRQVASALDNPLEKIALDRLREVTKERIQRAIAQELIRGGTFTDMARSIRIALGQNTNDALRIARTEGHRAVEMGHLARTDELVEKGYSVKKIWVSVEDDRTRGNLPYQEKKGINHVIMNDVEADKDGYFTLPDGARGPAPGLIGEAHHDINCRCTYVEEIEVPE
jgi:hypothetical protein